MIKMTANEYEQFTNGKNDTSPFLKPLDLPDLVDVLDISRAEMDRTRGKNREASRRGQAFEELIKLQCMKYRDSGEAVIDKTPEPFQVHKKKENGVFEGRFTKAKAQPDFQGTLKGGRSVLIEAKSTGKDRILYGALTIHQQELMENHSEMGALCIILCEIGDRHFSVPWETWRDMKGFFGHMYVTADEIKGYEVSGETGNPLPFLSSCGL